MEKEKETKGTCMGAKINREIEPAIQGERKE